MLTWLRVLRPVVLVLLTLPNSLAQDDFSTFFESDGHVVGTAPTSPPVMEAPIPIPVAMPVAMPVSPTPAPTNALTTSQSIYGLGEEISMFFVYNADDQRLNVNDWIGIYPSNVDPDQNSPTTFLFWCNQQMSCLGMSPTREGQVDFGPDRIVGTSEWPLPRGEYKAYLLRGNFRPFDRLAESSIFHVEQDDHLDVVIPTLATIVQEIRDVMASDELMGPKFVRLGFHDCVGGCDGCVDLTFADNAGLNLPIEALQPIVDSHENLQLGISRADIWALAAHIAADVAQTRSSTKVDFRMEFIGRQNCETTHTTCFDVNINARECSATLGPHVHLPSSHITTEELFHFFSEEFGFDIQETVALMGAHTLGALKREHSGFDGPNGWVRDNLLLNNDYYHELVGGQQPDVTLDELINGAPPWDKVRFNNEDLAEIPNQPAWIAFPPALNGIGTTEIIMLNADMALVRELNRTNMAEDGTVNCAFVAFFASRDSIPRCPHAVQSFDFAVEYKFNNELWLNDFAQVYKKMLNHGYPYDPTLECPGDLCVYPH